MRGSEPPRAATWLLEHLVPGSMSDALAGDLLEESARRGAAWYWRQVVLAIVIGLFRHVCREWVSIAYSFGWLYVSEALIRSGWMYYWPHGPWWVALPWPLSLIVEIASGMITNLVPFMLGLAVYLLIAGRFSFRGFTAGVATAIAALIVSDAGITLLHGNHHRVYWFLPTLMYTLVLVFSIWIGQRKSLHSNRAT
jgi:hypothetical protein